MRGPVRFDAAYPTSLAAMTPNNDRGAGDITDAGGAGGWVRREDDRERGGLGGHGEAGCGGEDGELRYILRVRGAGAFGGEGEQERRFSTAADGRDERWPARRRRWDLQRIVEG